MRIDPNNLSGVYESQMKTGGSTVGGEEIKENKMPKDRIELSSAYKKRSGINEIKSNVVSEIEKGASPEKLKMLKKQIQDGTYKVSSDDIAQAMLGMKEQK